MAKIRHYKDTERIEETRKLLCEINPFNNDSTSENMYVYLADCIYYYYINHNKKGLDNDICGLVNEMLGNEDKSVKEQLIKKILGLYDKWLLEDHANTDNTVLRNAKKYIHEKRNRDYRKGFIAGMSVMFLLMLAILIKALA